MLGEEQTSGVERSYVSGQTEGSNLPVSLPHSDPIIATENRLCAAMSLFPVHVHAVTEGQIWRVWVMSCVLQHTRYSPSLEICRSCTSELPVISVISVNLLTDTKTRWTARRFVTAMTLEQSDTAVNKVDVTFYPRYLQLYFIWPAEAVGLILDGAVCAPVLGLVEGKDWF